MVEVKIYGNLDRVIEELITFRKHGLDVYCVFNGVKLYSKNVTWDSAYLEVCGCTYSEYLRQEKEWLEQYKKREQEEKERSLARKPEWIERGHKLIDKKLWSEWERCIDLRISDLYNGKEIEYALRIMEAHFNGTSIEEICNMIKNQLHSNYSSRILYSIIKTFYINGVELINQIKQYESSNPKLKL